MDIIKDSKLFELTKDFVFKLFPLIEINKDDSLLEFNNYEEYPEVTFSENGLPSIKISKFNNPYDINNIFNTWKSKKELKLENFKEFNILKKYLLEHEEYKITYYPKHIEDKKNAMDLFVLYASTIPMNILERYYLLNNKKEENLELLHSIYLEFENYLYSTFLNIDIGIPILFLKFKDSEIKINNDIKIKRISKEKHKARFLTKSYSPAILDKIISSATHELVLENYFVRKKNFFGISSLNYESSYPIEKIELFFNAIKLITNHNSGFAQILAHPLKWSDRFNMDLPTMKGISLRKYPNYFDDFYWENENIPTISTIEANKIGKIYNNLVNIENNKIIIANKRLRLSYLRDSEEDSILDIIIALETLLSDNSKGELTYKLSMRIAKLLYFHNENFIQYETFEIMKKIYDYRSAVVHGSSKVNSKKEIKINKDNKSIKTISLANDYLREVLKIMINEPKFLAPVEIDKLLLS